MGVAVRAERIGRNAPCPCGSGRKSKHCCGGSRTAVPQTEAVLADAVRLLGSGRLDEAAGALHKLLGREPRNPYALYLLGLVHHRHGRIADADSVLARAFEAGLNDPAAHYHYAEILLLQRRVDDAVSHLEVAVATRPDFAEAHLRLGNIRYETGRFAAAETSYRRAEAAGARDWSLYFNLAHALHFQGRLDEALVALDAAAARAPQDAAPHAAKALLLESMHRLDEAQLAATRAAQLSPGHAGALLVLARLKARRRDHVAAARLLDGANEAGASPEHLIALWAERGKTHDALQAFDKALQAFRRSRTLAAAYYPDRFDPDNTRKRLRQYAAAFQGLSLPEIGRTPATPCPIFVLGFPRSGTSLLEQILASHRDIAGAGELDTLKQIQDELGADGAVFPATFSGLHEAEVRERIEAVRTRYLDEAVAQAPDGPGKRWIVDKHPFNSERLGLIHLMFPDAPILRIRRHPLDIVLSCYAQNFSAASPWTFSLEHIADYVAAVEEHVAAMRSALPLNCMEIRYEDVVGSPEASVRAVLAFIGADYDPNCLAFHENKRVVRTASYEQVTRKLYASSVGRYRQYLPFIDHAVVSRLESALASGGYAIER
jgi:tetratricopeptide (TPR) repeat protein